jgi:hypothetical protein
MSRIVGNVFVLGFPVFVRIQAADTGSVTFTSPRVPTVTGVVWGGWLLCPRDEITGIATRNDNFCF